MSRSIRELLSKTRSSTLTRWATWPPYAILAIGLLTLLVQYDPAGWYILGIGG